MKKQGVMLFVLVLMGATSFALMNYVDVSLEDRPGVRMTLPEHLGSWRGVMLKFCHEKECRKDFSTDTLEPGATACPECGGKLHAMSYEEWDQLPKDTEFVKSIYTQPSGDKVFASIVLTGRDRESIHRPERCLIGQGHKVDRYTSMQVPLENGRDLNTSILLTRREWNTPQGAVEGYQSYYLFWFVGLKRETSSHWWRMALLAWDRVVHSVAHQWAYIAVSGMRKPDSIEYEDEIRSFVPQLHKAIVLTPEELDAQQAAAPPATAALRP
jgi:hypothetical protein